MKQTLIIGSTVIDVLLRVPSLPSSGEDINIISSELRLGGCAYNVYKMLEFNKIPALLCSPVGSGIFGRMVREQLQAQGIKPFVLLEQENGCCYCIIEPDGERSFLSHHGAEYLFSRSWMSNIDYQKTDSFFICGLEAEEPTGEEIVKFAYEHPELEMYFAPGPRILHIPQNRMDRLLSRRDNTGKGPLLHLNKTEALSYSKLDFIDEAAEFLAEKTQNSVIITLGEKGCYYRKENSRTGGHLVPGFPAQVVDTIGTGDAHCGTLIGCLKKGMSYKKACIQANSAGAAVAGIKGAILQR